MITDLVAVSAALFGSLAGLEICWRAWRRGALGRRAFALAALPWSLSTALWIWRFGAEIGVPLMLETAALEAFAFLLIRAERRVEKPPRQRTAVALLPRNYLRGTLRVLTAGVLGFAAAMGPALLFATKAPFAEQTRLILAALAVPSLWCAAIAWTACDRRLAIQLPTFLCLALGGAGLTFLTA